MAKDKPVDDSLDEVTDVEPMGELTPAIQPPTITPLHLDLGREDLKSLVDKVNEIIQWINR